MKTGNIVVTLFGFLILDGIYDPISLFAFIRIETDGIVLNVPPTNKGQTKEELPRFISDLERITGLKLVVKQGYIRVLPDPLNVQSTFPVNAFATNSNSSSETARRLFLSAVQSTNVYKIQINRNANLGRVFNGDLIELDFLDQKYLSFRGVPSEVFNTSMIFFHELVHRHLALTDPTVDEILSDRNAKGKTVEFMNRIERELNLPERRHYFPKKNPVPSSTGFCIYFGNEGKRVEIDAEIFRSLIQSGKNTGYVGLLRN